MAGLRPIAVRSLRLVGGVYRRLTCADSPNNDVSRGNNGL